MMLKISTFLLSLFILAGCTQMEQEAQATRPAQVNAPGTNDPKKPKQWFTADTPETLPADKLEKMNLGGPGGFGGY